MATFRIEKTKDFTIMSNHHLKNNDLSLKAKGLQSLMLSLPDDWDYTTRGLATICKDGVDAIGTALKELENHGYLTRTRLRNEKGIITDVEYVIHEIPVPVEIQNKKAKKTKKNTGKSSNSRTRHPHTENPDMDNPDMDKPDLVRPYLENPAQLNTNQSRTKESSTNLSIHPSPSAEKAAVPAQPKLQDQMDRMDSKQENSYSNLRDTYQALVKKNIEYSSLVLKYDPKRVDSTLDLILDVLLSNSTELRIGRNRIPAEAVKSRYLSLTWENLEYVFDSMDKTTTKIDNIRAYLLTALYNAPVTMDSYYRAEVNHDLNQSSVG